MKPKMLNKPDLFSEENISGFARAVEDMNLEELQRTQATFLLLLNVVNTKALERAKLEAPDVEPWDVKLSGLGSN